jgi:endoglucanase
MSFVSEQLFASAFFIAFSMSLTTTINAKTVACDHFQTGVNNAGPAFAPTTLPGRLGYEYKFPNLEMLLRYKSIGFNSIRLSISWERIQPTLAGPLDDLYLKQIERVLEESARSDLKVLIDLHNYGRYRGDLIGSASVPESAFQDVWAKLSLALVKHPALYGYGLMNEPYNTGGTWEKVAQAGVDGIRKNDSKSYIYVAGDSFSSAERWTNTHKKPFVADPAGLEVYEAHLYLDKDASGKYTAINDIDGANVASTLAGTRLQGFVDWLKRFGKRGAIGEYGVPSLEPAWFAGIDTILKKADEHCLATFVWAGGAWSPGYKLSLEPNNGMEKPLTSWFRQYFKDRQKLVLQ